MQTAWTRNIQVMTVVKSKSAGFGYLKSKSEINVLFGMFVINLPSHQGVGNKRPCLCNFTLRHVKCLSHTPIQAQAIAMANSKQKISS